MGSLYKLQAQAGIILKQSFIYSFGGLGSGVLEVMLVPVYARAFSTQEYGLLDFLWTFIIFARLIVPLGLDLAVGRFYVDNSDVETDRQQTATTGLLAVLILTLLFASLTTLMSNLVAGPILRDVTKSNLVVWAAWATPGLVLYSFTTNMLRYNFKPSTQVLLSLTTVLADASATTGAVLGLRAGLAGVYMAKICVYTIASLIGLWLTRYSYAWRVSMDRLRSMLAYGLPLVPAALAYFVMSYSGRYFLPRFVNLEALGLYGAAYRLASMMALLYVGFTAAWGPFALGTYGQPQARQVFTRVFDYFSATSVVAVVGISLFAKELLTLYAGPAYAPAAIIVPMLLLNQALYVGGGYIFGISFHIAKKTGQYAVFALLAAAVCFVFQLLWIPEWGILGAAAAVTLSHSVFTVLMFWWGQRYYRVPYRLAAHGKLYGVAVVALFIGALTDRWSVALSVPLRLLLFIAVLSAPFVLHLLSISVIRSLTLSALRWRPAQVESNVD